MGCLILLFLLGFLISSVSGIPMVVPSREPVDPSRTSFATTSIAQNPANLLQPQVLEAESHGQKMIREAYRQIQEATSTSDHADVLLSFLTSLQKTLPYTDEIKNMHSTYLKLLEDGLHLLSESKRKECLEAIRGFKEADRNKRAADEHVKTVLGDLARMDHIPVHRQ
eukprot:NODE_491_length_7770_cov_0.866771.p4 type:complete len:168 gc:universal NODE_491_length_7770_cov_0.866771:1121-1624(+)